MITEDGRALRLVPLGQTTYVLREPTYSRLLQLQEIEDKRQATLLSILECLYIQPDPDRPALTRIFADSATAETVQNTLGFKTIRKLDVELGKLLFEDEGGAEKNGLPIGSSPSA